MTYALALFAPVFVALVLSGLVTTCCNAVDRGEPVRVTRVALSRYLRELGVHVLVGAMMPLGATDPDPHPTPEGVPERAPVLLIPGYAVNRACLFFLATYLRQRGFPWVWAINNRPYSTSIPEHARRLGEAVARLKATTGADKVDLVAHSMGGLVAAWYLRNLGGDLHVRQLITLGTPWQGTRMAIFGKRRQAADMMVHSPVLREILPCPVPALSIYSRTDTLVFPWTSATPAGLETLELPERDHLELLFAAPAFRAVRDRLLAPPAPRPPQALLVPAEDLPTVQEGEA